MLVLIKIVGKISMRSSTRSVPLVESILEMRDIISLLGFGNGSF